MRDEKIRQIMNDIADERDEEIYLFDNHAYDKSIIGLSADNRVIYDYNKMVEEFMEDEQCEAMEAIEWIDYNTIPSLPYLGDRAPIILMEPIDNLKEMY